METRDQKESLTFVIDELKYRVLSKEDKTVEVMAAKRRFSEFVEGVIGYPFLMGEVEIPSKVEYLGECYKVTAIADRAFENHSGPVSFGNHDYELDSLMVNHDSGIERVIIPPTVRKIGARAFYNCPSLSSINIPASVEIIGDKAFMGCFVSWDPCPEPYAEDFCGLKHVTIEENIDDMAIDGFIGESAFANCQLLEQIEIPGRFKSIGYSAFSGCYYNHCSFLSSQIDESTEYGLKTVVFHEGVKIIGADVFENCDALKSFNLPKTVEEIDESLFNYSYNSVEKHFFETTSNEMSMIIPWHIRRITNCRFSFINYCINTIKIYIDNPDEIEIDDYVFSDRYGLKLKVLSGCVEKYKASKFWSCFKSIEELGSTERQSFVANGLRYIVLSYSKRTVEVMSSYIPLERYGENVDDIDFQLEELVIPDVVDYEGKAYQVTKISSHGFVNHANLKSISIGRNVERIDDYAFYKCGKLASVIIPAKVIDIGEYAFAELGSVSIQIEETDADNVNFCTINPHAFENSGRGDLILPRQVKVICECAFHNHHFSNIQIVCEDVLIGENNN